MLRLWPDRVVIGLFPGQCWIRQGRVCLQREVGTHVCVDETLAVLDSLIAELPKGFGRFASADVYLSDAFARAILVRWQDKLTSETQRVAYGAACIQASGTINESDWTVHCGFRCYAAPGMAVAIPTTTIEALRARLAAIGIRLNSVVPLAAAAYWLHRPDSRSDTSLLLLEEAERFTGLVYARGKLLSMDVEPVLVDGHAASTRIFNRLKLAVPTVSRIDFWSLLPGALESKGALDAFGARVIFPVQLAPWSIH